jgi:2,4-dienoyl-CoA reductase
MAASFSGKVVLITGGGTGLGFACAKKYALLGGTVVITGRRESVLLKAAEAIKLECPGSKVFAVAMDVKSNESVNAGIEKLLQLTNNQLPSVVLNNAAGNFISPSERLSPNAWKSINDIVFMGTVNVTMELAKRWIVLRKEAEKSPSAAPQPQVVFMQVGTSYVDRGQPFLAPSSAAKAAVWSLTQSLAREFGRFNMRFIMVSPGPIYTEGAFSRLDPSGEATSPEAIKLRVPLGRMGTVDEYAEFVAFVTSDKASWLNGANIHFDGGSHAQGLEFFGLQDVTSEQWDMMEAHIRGVNAKSKKQGSKL